MSDGKKLPAFRLKYRDKESKITYDCGVAWPGRFEDSWDVQPQVGDVQHEKYPKMDTGRAFQNAAEKRGWLTLSRVRSGASQGRPSHNLGDFGSDPDVPF